MMSERNIWFRFGLFLTMLSVTACAPVIHTNTEYRHRSQPTHISVQATHGQTHHDQLYQAIQVTLYADTAYRGGHFQPIQLVIANGQYVEIPVKNRRGRMTRIYAHYHNNDLHFDSSRSCRRIPGSTSYKYIKTWDKGHKYGHINAGKNYDLSGLHLRVRNLAKGDQYANKKVAKRVQVASGKNDIKVTNNFIKTTSYKTNNRIDVKNKATTKKAKTNKAAHKPSIVQKLESAKVYRKTSTVKRKVNKVDTVSIKRDKAVKEQQKARHNVKNKVAAKTGNDSRDDLDKGVRVSFISGLIKVGNKQGALKRSSLTLKNGESRNITLVARNGNKVVVPVAYRNGTLKVARQRDVFKIDSSWDKGKTYNLSTSGKARIENVQFTVATL